MQEVAWYSVSWVGMKMAKKSYNLVIMTSINTFEFSILFTATFIQVYRYFKTRHYENFRVSPTGKCSGCLNYGHSYPLAVIRSHTAHQMF